MWLRNAFTWMSEVRSFGNTVGVEAEETIIIAKPWHRCWSRCMWARKEAEQKGDCGELPDTREKHVCPEKCEWGWQWQRTSSETCEQPELRMSIFLTASVRGVRWQHRVSWACQCGGRCQRLLCEAEGSLIPSSLGLTPEPFPVMGMFAASLMCEHALLANQGPRFINSTPLPSDLFSQQNLRPLIPLTKRQFEVGDTTLLSFGSLSRNKKYGPDVVR